MTHLILRQQYISMLSSCWILSQNLYRGTANLKTTFTFKFDELKVFATLQEAVKIDFRFQENGDVHVYRLADNHVITTFCPICEQKHTTDEILETFHYLDIRIK